MLNEHLTTCGKSAASSYLRCALTFFTSKNRIPWSRSGRKPFSQDVTIFHGRWLREAGTPVGYAALIDAYDLNAPMPITLSAIGQRHKVYQADGWNLYTPRHRPDADLEGHLVFAPRYEELDLAVLKTLFHATGPEPITAIVKASRPEPMRGGSGFSMNGCSMSGWTCPMRPRAAMRSSSIRRGSGPSMLQRHHVIGSRTTCRERPPSARWSFAHPRSMRSWLVAWATRHGSLSRMYRQIYYEKSSIISIVRSGGKTT